MGCGGSKNQCEVLIEQNTPNTTPDKQADANPTPDHQSTVVTDHRKMSTVSIPNIPPGHPEIPLLKPVQLPTTLKPVAKEPISFDILAEDESSESIINRHPPKRLQKLEIQEPTLTPEALATKQAIAEERRKMHINNRVQSAKKRTAKSAHVRSTRSASSDNSEEPIETPDPEL